MFMSRRYWILFLLLIIATFLIYFSKSIEVDDYNSCINQGGVVDYDGNSAYCEMNGKVYFSYRINN